ncbi:hypothetical protein ISX56_29160, partial [Serratia ureilytica]|nr:hypothetical protein [Serratia ureilytica]
ESDRCALELSDARVDVLGYACLVAIMAMGLGYHRESQARLAQVTKDNQAAAPVISSAGALVNGLKVIGAKRIALVAPYMKPLTQLVVDYIQHEGIEVKVWRALAFIALIALLNGILGGIGGWFDYPQLSLELILGWVFSPIAFLIGVPWSEAMTAGSFIGQKIIVNEFVA